MHALYPTYRIFFGVINLLMNGIQTMKLIPWITHVFSNKFLEQIIWTAQHISAL